MTFSQKIKHCLLKGVLTQLGNPYFSINEMGITINPSDKMEFRVTFGLGGACMNVDGANASFSLNHIKNYIR